MFTKGSNDVVSSCSTDNDVTKAKMNREIEIEHIADFAEQNCGK